MLHVAWQCDSLTSDGNFAYGVIHKWHNTDFHFFDPLPPMTLVTHSKSSKIYFFLPTSFPLLDEIIYGWDFLKCNYMLEFCPFSYSCA